MGGNVYCAGRSGDNLPPDVRRKSQFGHAEKLTGVTVRITVTALLQHHVDAVEKKGKNKNPNPYFVMPHVFFRRKYLLFPTYKLSLLTLLGKGPKKRKAPDGIDASTTRSDSI